MSERTDNSTPRPPTDPELDELTTWLVGQSHNQETAQEIAQRAYVAVFDNYQTDGLGYAGKVMAVVWSGSPSVFNVFVWHDGKMRDEVHDLFAGRAE